MLSNKGKQNADDAGQGRCQAKRIPKGDAVKGAVGNAKRGGNQNPKGFGGAMIAHHTIKTEKSPRGPYREGHTVCGSNALWVWFTARPETDHIALLHEASADCVVLLYSPGRAQRGVATCSAGPWRPFTSRLHDAGAMTFTGHGSHPIVVDYDAGFAQHNLSSSASMPQVTLEQLARHSHFFIAGMEAPRVPDTGFHAQHPNFLLKPNFDPTKRTVDWDPCAARVFAPVEWKRQEHENETVWALKGAKPQQDGIYVDSQQRDEARLPNTKVTTHEDLAGALFTHWVFCQVSHEHCLQTNEIRRREAEDHPEHEHATFDDEVEYMGMGWRADAFFAKEGTMDSLISAPSRAEFEAHPDADYY
ncbi:hypothetical protein DFH06DRAFT_1152555 [Mycena polygramma]|nr:hypothetical protein DFH06DRAFT_1152555 [Mycena polygramma]